MTSPSIVLLRTQSDARLVALAREGHERAFEAIVERYRRPLLRTCRRVLPEARAEDALQQALLAAWTALGRGDEIRELRPWLHRICHNTALNQLRVSGYDFDELKDSLQIADAADDELERRAVMRHTLAGLAALPDRQREALMAIAVEGRSQDEVASDLGLSSGAVRQLVHRARSSLRAAATAITPLPLAGWIAAAAARGEPMASRIAELTAGAGGAGAAAALAKAGTVAVLAGTAVTGPAVLERTEPHRGAAHAYAARAGSATHSRSAPRERVVRAAPVTRRAKSMATPPKPVVPRHTVSSGGSGRHRSVSQEDRADDHSGSSSESELGSPDRSDDRGDTVRLRDDGSRSGRDGGGETEQMSAFQPESGDHGDLSSNSGPGGGGGEIDNSGPGGGGGEELDGNPTP
jgi:RNA polymerase sigma factor (sigma-70 family)